MTHRPSVDDHEISTCNNPTSHIRIKLGGRWQCRYGKPVSTSTDGATIGRGEADPVAGPRGRASPAESPDLMVSIDSRSLRPAESAASRRLASTSLLSSSPAPVIWPSANAARFSVWFLDPSGASRTRSISPLIATAAHRSTASESRIGSWAVAAGRSGTGRSTARSSHSGIGGGAPSRVHTYRSPAACRLGGAITYPPEPRTSIPGPTRFTEL